MASCLDCFRTVLRQAIMVAMCGRGSPLTPLYGSKKKKKERRKGHSPDNSPPRTCLQLLKDFSVGPYCFRLPPNSNCATLESKLSTQHMSLWGNILDLNHSIRYGW